MSRQTRSGVLVAGLILIAIGILFLLNNFYEISAWRLLARYWPILLIIVGLRKLYGYITWQENPPALDQPVKE
jgi:hypothetical protein